MVDWLIVLSLNFVASPSPFGEGWGEASIGPRRHKARNLKEKEILNIEHGIKNDEGMAEKIEIYSNCCFTITGLKTGLKIHKI
jgi:hypothetical protein